MRGSSGGAAPEPGARVRAERPKLAATLASGSFAAVGICLTLPGSLLPVLVERFAMGWMEAGSMLACLPAGHLTSVLAAARIVERAGMRRTLSTSVLLLAAGVAGFGLASSWVAGAAMLLVAGLGIGVMEVAANTLLIRVGGERSTNLLNFTHLFFGVGSFVAPALATQAVASGLSWRGPFLVGGALIGLVGLGWRAVPDAAAGPGEAASAEVGDLRALLRAMLPLAALLGLYVGCEAGIGSWATEYLTSVRGLPLAAAGRGVAGYWMGLTVGRIVLTALGHRVGEERLLLASTAFSATAFAAALAAPAPWLAVVGLAATGLGFAGIFPAGLALGGRLRPASVARVTSLLIAAAGIGQITIPLAMSAVADLVGLTAGMAVYAALMAAMAVLALSLLVAAGRKEVGRRASVAR